MSLTFNTILAESNIDPCDVRLIRHKDKGADPGRSPYELWRDELTSFQEYQSRQSIENRSKFNADYWAVFVVDSFEDTIFAGLYSATYKGLLAKDVSKVERVSEIDKAGSCDTYKLNLDKQLKSLIGRLVIDWGPAKIAWVQYADRQNKRVLELRGVEHEPPFPGLLNFIEPLSRISKLPKSWIEVLRSARGVYILSCPRTKEQYVGSADGEAGFMGRWMQYLQTGHGGNVALKSREPSDYQVAILEVAGTSATHADILAMEGRWQRKLQSREMGLNRNLAKS